MIPATSPSSVGLYRAIPCQKSEKKNPYKSSVFMMKYEILLVTKMFLAVFTINLGFGAVLGQKLKIFPKRLVAKSAF